MDPALKEGDKEVKSYLKDQMQADIDYLKTVMISEDKFGTMSNLKALRRAINLVDSPEEENKKAFKKVFLYLKSIAKHGKKSKIYFWAYQII